MGQTSVLIVDDSVLMQRVLSDIIRKDPSLTVIGAAKNGEEAITKIANLHPDVVTMDVEMPKMDGLTAVQKIMDINPLPIVMVSALTQKEAQITLKALQFGAVDFVAKPSGSISMNMEVVQDELLSKIKVASKANVKRILLTEVEDILQCAKYSDKIISIAASTGGPPAVHHILKNLPKETPPILIVQHMPKGVTRLFAEGLNMECKIKVKEAQDGDALQNGLALIAPGGFHMTVTKESKVMLNSEPPVNYVRPAADVTMISAAQRFGQKNVGVILTGMGSDGAKGIKIIKENGGTTIAQDEKSCVVFGMPNVAIQTGCVDVISPLEFIPRKILKACE